MRVLALLAVFGLGGLSQALADPTPMTISPKSPLSDIASIRPAAPIRYDPRIVVFEASDRFACDGGVALTPLRPFDATPEASQVMIGSTEADGAPAIPNFAPPPIEDPQFDYSFNVSAGGRPLDIAAIPKSEVRAAPHQPFVDEQGVQAAIAALSFAEGHAASGCRIHVSGRVLTDQAAARADLLKMFALTPYASLKSPIYRAAVPAGSDCLDGETLHRRVQYFAAVDELHEPPGVRSWVVVQYDIGPDGHARHVQIAASSGAADLDARAVDAATRNVFAPQAKQACLARYYDTPGIVPAPPIAKDARPEPSQCAANVKLDFGTLDFYPKAFADRGIEGYALMQFDVAPWGGLGQVQVLKSEPAAAFGQAAQNLMRLGKAAPGQGLRGCVVPIRFKIPPP